MLDRDEFAVEPLIDEFYAGVNEPTGLAIIDIVATIGGYEAQQFLEDLAEHALKPAWRDAARSRITPR